MAEGSASNRWWENYLVRYFLPSLAGMLILYWLQRFSGASLYLPPFLPDEWKDFNTAHLIFWLLLGSLYSYIASYPALVFHATRILDFRDVQGRPANWPYRFLNPYGCSIAFTLLVGVSAWRNQKWCAAFLVLLFTVLQVYRILKVSSAIGRFGLDKDFDAQNDASIAYAYLRKLSERRAVITQERAKPKEEEKAKGKTVETVTIRKDEQDLVASYRHLREHGNTALIVLLEFALCPVLYLVLECQSRPGSQVLFVGVLVLWVFPSVLIHGLAQHIERRFSYFQYSVEDTAGGKPEMSPPA